LISAEAVVQQFLDAARRHDLDGMLAVLAEDAYFVPSGQGLHSAYGDFSGHEGWREWWAVTNGDRISVDTLALEQLNDHRVVAELLIGRSTGDGFESVVRVGVYTVSDAKIAAVEIFTNRDVAYERLWTRSPAEGAF
jgi:ketosteroid isomerase-like protein